MKVITDLYAAICDTVETNLKDFEWIDWWRNQVSLFDENYPFPFPAMFLEIRMGDTSDMGDKAQMATTQIDFYIAKETLADSNGKSKTRDKALEFAHLLDAVYDHFSGWKSENNQPFSFIELTPEESQDHVQLYRMVFETVVSFKKSEKPGETITDPQLDQEKAEYSENSNEGEKDYDIPFG